MRKKKYLYKTSKYNSRYGKFGHRNSRYGKRKRKRKGCLTGALLVVCAIVCVLVVTNFLPIKSVSDVDLESLPDYQGEPYVELNGNEPEFSDEEVIAVAFEDYGEQDRLGRCTVARACLGEETMPEYNEERGEIYFIHPSGWKSGQNWERCHLIAWCLSAENANERNLITGTHYFNSEGMLPFEEEVAKYIDRTGNHVMYEVIPIYDGNNLIASGVQMQAESVEDYGWGVSFNVFCYNVEPEYEIDYRSGDVYRR